MQEQNNPPQPEEMAFLQELRSTTGELHEALEALPLSKSLMGEDVSLQDYADYLACMKDVMVYYDKEVLPKINTVISDTTQRTKSAALTADLGKLSSNGVVAFDVQPLETENIQSEAFAMGLAYVIEGSTLGGRVILKHLDSKLNISETGAASFFAGYMHNTGLMWKDFLGALMKYGAKAENKDQVIAGALAGFKMIHNHFTNNSVPA